MADILIGNVKGPQGEQGVAGVQGEQGEAATIEVGTVTTVPYGQTASVVNSGTESEAVFDFTIPQGRPGEQVTDMQNLTLGSITTSAAEFPIPAVGETGKVLWGKVVKWFSDMSALVATKLNVANVVNNLTTTSSGYALDARQGKTLDDYMSEGLILTPVSVTQAVNVAALGTVTVPFGKPTIPGYTPLVFIYGSATTSNLSIVQGNSSYYYSDTRNVVFKNISGATYNGNVTFNGFVLMVKNHLYGGLMNST